MMRHSIISYPIFFSCEWDLRCRKFARIGVLWDASYDRVRNFLSLSSGIPWLDNLFSSTKFVKNSDTLVLIQRWFWDTVLIKGIANCKNCRAKCELFLSAATDISVSYLNEREDCFKSELLKDELGSWLCEGVGVSWHDFCFGKKWGKIMIDAWKLSVGLIEKYSLRRMLNRFCQNSSLMYYSMCSRTADKICLFRLKSFNSNNLTWNRFF